MSRLLHAASVAALLSAVPMASNAAIVSVGPGGFDNGWATGITYDDAAARGTSFQRDDPLNALGAPDATVPATSAGDGGFFEIGLGSFIDLTFGTLFDTSATVFEVTFGSVTAFPELAQISVGLNGVFFPVGGPLSNAAAQGGVVIGIGTGTFDTVRITDLTVTSAATGGFDVDAVRVSPVPLPAGGFLLLGALGAAAVARRRKG